MALSSILPYLTDGLFFVSLYFEVFMLIALLQKRSLRDRHEQEPILPAVLPSVAIVVPCFNEEHTVGPTIESLLALEYPADLLEVIVVDDGSTDATLAAAKRYEGERVRVLSKENGGKHSALNLALSQTDADLIGCLDADSVVAADALKRTVAAFTDENVAAVTPGIHIQKPQTLIQHLQEAEYRLAIFTRAAFADIGATYITPGPFSIFRTHIVREAGGWRHAHATEDLELGLRLQERGAIIRNEPYAAVYTKTPSTVRALVKQRVRWTYGFLRNAFDYRHMIGNWRYGNLGLLALPFGIISIGVVFYFVALITYDWAQSLANWMTYVSVTHTVFAAPSFDPFFIDTTVMSFIVYLSTALVLVLLFVGSRLSSRPERKFRALGTSLFLLFYGFLTPIWLGIAVARASFRTGVDWKGVRNR
ncbi:MAG TPA: glycosyltransferase family 2 protein [Candidatus Paceibacterota bacterium]|nr:glycosyltransferase family 2 protein [Candidatus Paceibacterota bacterium]